MRAERGQAVQQDAHGLAPQGVRLHPLRGEGVEGVGQLSELIAKKKTFEALQNTGKRDIILGKLDMLSTGYIYGTVNTMEKVVRESTLPYVDVSFLNDVSKIDQQSESALKIVDNDRLFAAFIVDRDELIGGESQALAMKKKIVGTKGKKAECPILQLFG